MTRSSQRSASIKARDILFLTWAMAAIAISYAVCRKDIAVYLDKILALIGKS